MACKLRHERERHGMHGHTSFPCPVDTCDRHLNHFPRQWNQRDHMRRVHQLSADPSANDQSSMEEELNPKPRKRKPGRPAHQGGKRSRSSVVSPTSASSMAVEPRRSPDSEPSIVQAQEELNSAKNELTSALNGYFIQLDHSSNNLPGRDLQRQTQALREIATISNKLRNDILSRGSR